MLLGLLLAGMLIITLNYLAVLPGSTSSWYLVAGLVLMFAAFYMATRYR
jgi:LPXTG-motif cell wall-anchored protein